MNSLLKYNEKINIQYIIILKIILFVKNKIKII